jgi:hypothetical protein
LLAITLKFGHDGDTSLKIKIRGDVRATWSEDDSETRGVVLELRQQLYFEAL